MNAIVLTSSRTSANLWSFLCDKFLKSDTLNESGNEKRQNLRELTQLINDMPNLNTLVEVFDHMLIAEMDTYTNSKVLADLMFITTK